VPSNRRRRHKTGPTLSAAFTIGPVALPAGLQVSTPSLSTSTAAAPDHLLSRSRRRCRRLRPPQLGVAHPLFLSCLWLRTLVVTFSLAPVNPCASRTRHDLTTRHFSHWPRRTITIGPFPPCGATGDARSARGRKRDGIEAVKGKHRVDASTTRHRAIMHVVRPDDAQFSSLAPSRIPPPNLPVPIRRSRHLAWRSAQTEGANETVRWRGSESLCQHADASA